MVVSSLCNETQRGLRVNPFVHLADLIILIAYSLFKLNDMKSLSNSLQVTWCEF